MLTNKRPESAAAAPSSPKEKLLHASMPHLLLPSHR
jgi:hypothetical protein